LNPIDAGADLDSAEADKVIGKKLRVEQGKTADVQPRDECSQRHF
jgi:hypothetical protein